MRSFEIPAFERESGQNIRHVDLGEFYEKANRLILDRKSDLKAVECYPTIVAPCEPSKNTSCAKQIEGQSRVSSV